MRKIANDQNGFGAVEGLLLVIAITLVVGVGMYVVNSNKSDKKDVSTQTIKAPSAQTTLSDKDLITKAVRDYKEAGDQSGATVTVESIVGDNAQGSFNDGTEGSGAAFIAHKSNGTWQVVYEGQEAPGADIGHKYNLPADWYANY